MCIETGHAICSLFLAKTQTVQDASGSRPNVPVVVFPFRRTVPEIASVFLPGTLCFQLPYFEGRPRRQSDLAWVGYENIHQILRNQFFLPCLLFGSDVPIP